MNEEATISRAKPGQELGTRAVWGKVGYSGKEFAPAAETYVLHNPNPAAFSTIADSGRLTDQRAPLANLVPLIAAAQHEIGFAWEAGPLSTWRN